MPLFGDALKAYNFVQQAPMLPAMAAMQAAKAVGSGLKKHTPLGKTVQNKTNDVETKRIWRGSRFLRKHILERRIHTLNALTGGAVKRSVDGYAAYHATGKTLAQRNAEIGARTTPSPLRTRDLIARYKAGEPTPEDLQLLEKLNLSYNPLTDSLATPEALKASSHDEILKRFMEDPPAADTKALLARLDTQTLTEQDQNILRAFGLEAKIDGSLEKLNELPLNPPEQKLCAYFDDSFEGKQGLKMEDIKDDVLKLNLRTIRAQQFDKLDNGMQEVFKELNLSIKQGKLVETKMAKPLHPLPRQLSEAENKLSEIEKEAYTLFSNTKEDIQRISDMQNPDLKKAFTQIREGKLNELDPRIQLGLSTLGLSVEEGKLVGPIQLKKI